VVDVMIGQMLHSGSDVDACKVLLRKYHLTSHGYHSVDLALVELAEVICSAPTDRSLTETLKQSTLSPVVLELVAQSVLRLPLPLPRSRSNQSNTTAGAAGASGSAGQIDWDQLDKTQLLRLLGQGALTPSAQARLRRIHVTYDVAQYLHWPFQRVRSTAELSHSEVLDALLREERQRQRAAYRRRQAERTVDDAAPAVRPLDSDGGTLPKASPRAKNPTDDTDESDGDSVSGSGSARKAGARKPDDKTGSLKAKSRTAATVTAASAPSLMLPGSAQYAQSVVERVLCGSVPSGSSHSGMMSAAIPVIGQSADLPAVIRCAYSSPVPLSHRFFRLYRGCALHLRDSAGPTGTNAATTNAERGSTAGGESSDGAYPSMLPEAALDVLVKFFCDNYW